MRAGRLTSRAMIQELRPDLSVLEHGRVWVDVRVKDAAEGSAQAGLRMPTKADIRAREVNRLAASRYLRLVRNDRLFHLLEVRPLGNQGEFVMTADELVGLPAWFEPMAGVERPCRVYLEYSAPLLDDLQQVVEHRTRAQLALVETGPIEVDDQLRVAGARYRVMGFAQDSDDGVVRSVWLEAL